MELAKLHDNPSNVSPIRSENVKIAAWEILMPAFHLADTCIDKTWNECVKFCITMPTRFRKNSYSSSGYFLRRMHPIQQHFIILNQIVVKYADKVAIL